jgi:hypothetical protein
MRAIAVALLLLSAGAMPSAAQAWLTIGDVDSSFWLEMLVPFDVPPSETEPDGTVSFSYVHETPELTLRVEVVDTSDGTPVTGPLIFTSRTMEGARVLQTRTYLVGLRTYRLIATSTPELENDPVIDRFLGSMRLAR